MFRGPFKTSFAYTFFGMCIVVLLSAATFYSPSWFQYAFWLILVCTGIVGLWRFDAAALILLSELFVGSQGRLFSVEISGFSLSLRMGLFIIVALLWIVRRRWQSLPNLRSSPITWWALAFLFLLIVGVAVGYFLGNRPSFLFYDVNGYVFILSGFFFFSIIRTRDDVGRVLGALAANAVFSAVAVLIVLAIFSHGYDISHEVYRWLRDTRMFEITGLGNNYYRIFSQAHVFSLLAFFVFLPLWIFGNSNVVTKRFSLFVVACSSLTLLMSFSRSFWVALFVTTGFMLPWLFRHALHTGLRLKLLAVTFLAMLLADALVITFVANYPLLYGRSGGKTAIQVIGERTTDVAEPGVASRYALLKPLLRAGIKHPIFGSGFGSSVTYTTSDPRIIAQTGGSYTTYAFEWGYFDLFLKLGILGIAVIAGLFLALFQESRVLLSRGRSSTNDWAITAGFLLALIALYVTHVASPYLNHPTGLGFLMIMASVLFVLQKRPSPFMPPNEA